MLALNLNWVFTFKCIFHGSICTLQLREELSQLNFHALYRLFEINRPGNFWVLASAVIEMLYDSVSHDYLQCSETITKKIPES